MRAVRILVVDDDNGFLDIVAPWLSRRGFMVMATSDASEALLTAERVQLDVAVVDWGPDGSSTVRLVRQLKALQPSLLLVIICGDPLDTLVEKVRSLGVMACIAKPFSVRNLEVSIREVLRTQVDQLRLNEPSPRRPWRPPDNRLDRTGDWENSICDVMDGRQ